MKRLSVISLLLFVFLHVDTEAQNQSKNDQYLKISNDKIERLLSFENGKITSLVFQLTDYPLNFVSIEKRRT